MRFERNVPVSILAQHTQQKRHIELTDGRQAVIKRYIHIVSKWMFHLPI